MSTKPLAINYQIPMDEIVGLALDIAKEKIFWDWDYKRHPEGWDVVLGRVLSEVDRREIQPLRDEIERLRASK